jgi:acyl-CoA dehydrogenase
MAIRSLCAAFPNEYFRGVDAKRGYPEEFADSLIKAGWLSAMIPKEYCRRMEHIS